jgi:uracil-DNA glycosylase family 4
MEGFFSKKETASDARPDGRHRSCVSCGLSKGINSPKMKPSGGFKKGILNIGLVPGKIDDRKGTPFQGKEFRMLKKHYTDLGIDLYEDCLNTYAVHCASEEATLYHAECCRKTTLKIIKKYKPKVIVLFGKLALFSLIGHRWKKDFGEYHKWRGWQIPDQDLETWICPVPELSSILDSPSGIDEVIFRQDLEKAVALIDTPLRTYPEPEIIYLEKEELTVLDSIQVGNIAFDYETTGKKPQGEGHAIVCMSVAVSENKVYTFMIPKRRKYRKPILNLLTRESVGKIAQNMKFEDTWSTVILGVTPVNWIYDTMLASHIIDNRTGVTGLKFQTYVQFGIIDYDSGVAPYLRAKDDKNGNAINQVWELVEKPDGKKELLKYCGWDSILEYRLAELTRLTMMGTQGKSEISPINSDFPHAYRLLHEGTLAFAKAERQGLRIDTNYCKRQSRRLTKKVEKSEAKLKSTKFFRHWQHSTNGNVNINSNPQLGNFLYGVKKIKPPMLTDTGKGSTTDEALKMLKIPELDIILERSKLLKNRDTYLEAFVREQVNYYLHPSFNLNVARTYRSSSSNPNFQNIPKRDKQAMKLVRQSIFPRPGHQLLEVDYSGIEVSIAAAYHKDPTMMDYLINKKDMHGDMAKQIFKIDDWDKSRSDHAYLRSAAKNGFVFPQFYGDYYANNAASLCGSWVSLPQSKWKKGMGYEMNDGSTIGDHLIKKGLDSYDKFVDHIKEIESHFWKKRFPVYAKWKESHYKQYLKNGYVSLKTGFVCRGVMSKNDVINYPVQGAAFHCLLWAFTQLDKVFEKYRFDTLLVGQIHDAIVLDVNPKELEEVYKLVQNIGTKQLPKAFKWINVPLSIDAELCPVDGSWAEKQDWKPF